MVGEEKLEMVRFGGELPALSDIKEISKTARL